MAQASRKRDRKDPLGEELGAPANELPLQPLSGVLDSRTSTSFASEPAYDDVRRVSKSSAERWAKAGGAAGQDGMPPPRLQWVGGPAFGVILAGSAAQGRFSSPRRRSAVGFASAALDLT